MARILIGNIKGPKGDTGPQGIQGEIGPAGPQGPLPPLANNFLTTVAGVSALDAVAGKTLKDMYDGLNSNLKAGIATIPSGTGSISVSFDSPFSAIPKVVVTAHGASPSVALIAKIGTISANEFTVYINEITASGVQTPSYVTTVEWIAVKK